MPPETDLNSNFSLLSCARKLQMILFKKPAAIHSFLAEKKKLGLTVGFVPTMGALHEGHLSLIRRAVKENDVTVCSIYVNPAQFNDPKDLEKYPRSTEHDIEALTTSRCTILFLPSTPEIYRDGIQYLKDYDLGELEYLLEGAHRPGHFKGVANVVDRFLEIILPDRLYLGQKDFQQVKVLEKLVAIRNYHLKIIMCPIIREENGLAMSSRNVRLTVTQRENASGISKALLTGTNEWPKEPLKQVREHLIHRINSIAEASVDYLEFCNAKTFQIINDWQQADHIVCVTAVKVGEVRLLDNVLVN